MEVGLNRNPHRTLHGFFLEAFFLHASEHVNRLRPVSGCTIASPHTLHPKTDILVPWTGRRELEVATSDPEGRRSTF